MIFKNTFKYKRADKYTKIKWIILKFMLYRSYILHFRVRMVQLSKSLHPHGQPSHNSHCRTAISGQSTQDRQPRQQKMGQLPQNRNSRTNPKGRSKNVKVKFCFGNFQKCARKNRRHFSRKILSFKGKKERKCHAKRSNLSIQKGRKIRVKNYKMQVLALYCWG